MISLPLPGATACTLSKPYNSCHSKIRLKLPISSLAHLFQTTCYAPAEWASVGQKSVETEASIRCLSKRAKHGDTTQHSISNEKQPSSLYPKIKSKNRQ